MSDPAYNSFLLDYFGKFVEWLCSQKDGVSINVFQIDDRFLGEILYSFRSRNSQFDEKDPKKRLITAQKNYRKFKALISLPDGNRSAEFKEYGLLYMRDQGVYKLIVSNKMQKIYIASLSDEGINMRECIKLAKEEFYTPTGDAQKK